MAKQNHPSKSKLQIKKETGVHFATLLAAAKKQYNDPNLNKIVLRKMSDPPLEKNIQDFNQAIHLDPNLKNYEFHAFEDGSGSRLHEESKVCTDSSGDIVDCPSGK
jgi:hypothetical protein